ncbi:fumarate/nitrate reduction transcriptional regulator Fnr [Rheinheimera marina]|uniref:Fumarate/nitrate reduction transcriptional regulator Fnr n=1 Tax=Rheinheimera marina TaxID=1774958 RepID=A0ABV9JJ31_9GAMM
MSHSNLNCQHCGFSQLCLPFTLSTTELDTLDEIIERKKPYHKSDYLFESGKKLTALYAVRSGSFKTYTLTESGEEQITGFHLPGDVIGFDAIGEQQHPSYAQALETAMVCEIPFSQIDQLMDQLPKLRQQLMRLMSQDISGDQQMLLLLNRKNAEEKLAAFLANLANRFGNRGFSRKEFRLSMTRGEIGNYLGLTVETISRLLGRFHKDELILVDGKLITIVDPDALQQLAGQSVIAR